MKKICRLYSVAWNLTKRSKSLPQTLPLSDSLVARTYEEDMSSLLSGMELDEAVQELAADSAAIG